MRKHHTYTRGVTLTRGFTLIELLSSLAILLLLTGLAIPSMANLIAKNRVITQSNSIIGSLNLARSYAINTQKNVHICHLSSDGDANSKNHPVKCDTNRDFNRKWSNGWIVFADNDADNEFTDVDDLLRVVEMHNPINIVFNQRGRLRYFGNGSARSAGFYVCDLQQQSFRHVYLLHTGRARINQNLTAKQKKICDKADDKN